MAEVAEVVRAWRDGAFVSTINESLPDNPAGSLKILDAELDFVLNAPPQGLQESIGDTHDSCCTATPACNTNGSACCLTHFSSNPNCCF